MRGLPADRFGEGEGEGGWSARRSCWKNWRAPCATHACSAIVTLPLTNALVYRDYLMYNVTTSREGDWRWRIRLWASVN